MVPIGAAWIVAEPLVDGRADRYRTFARAGVARWLSAVTVDTKPAASPEAVPPGAPAAYAANVSALRGFDTVVAMGDSVAAEWRGLVTMLGALGIDGPDGPCLPSAGRSALARCVGPPGRRCSADRAGDR